MILLIMKHPDILSNSEEVAVFALNANHCNPVGWL
jgi:hypothetical protein